MLDKVSFGFDWDKGKIVFHPSQVLQLMPPRANQEAANAEKTNEA